MHFYNVNCNDFGKNKIPSQIIRIDNFAVKLLIWNAITNMGFEEPQQKNWDKFFNVDLSLPLIPRHLIDHWMGMESDLFDMVVNSHLTEEVEDVLREQVRANAEIQYETMTKTMCLFKIDQRLTQLYDQMVEAGAESYEIHRIHTSIMTTIKNFYSFPLTLILRFLEASDSLAEFYEFLELAFHTDPINEANLLLEYFEAYGEVYDPNSKFLKYLMSVVPLDLIGTPELRLKAKHEKKVDKNRVSDIFKRRLSYVVSLLMAISKLRGELDKHRETLENRR